MYSCHSPLGELTLLCSGEDAIGPIACKDLAIGAEQPWRERNVSANQTCCMSVHVETMDSS